MEKTKHFLQQYRLPNFLLYLAPMEDISDSPFRQICREMGADIVVSEFINAEAIRRQAVKGKRKLRFVAAERPLGIQIYGNSVIAISEAAKQVVDYEPDFIDINVGCPAKKVVKNGQCSALLKDLGLLRQIIRSVVRMVNIPVTVKMRIGWDKHSIVIPEAVKMMEDEGISSIVVHGRTRDQGYKGTADWSYINLAAESVFIPVIGNGDIQSPEIALNRKNEIPKLAGIMVGRSAIGAPWIFRNIRDYLDNGQYQVPTIIDRIRILKRHLTLSVRERGEEIGVKTMRKHYSGYMKGFHQSASVRAQLMLCVDLDCVFALLDQFETKRTHNPK